MDGFLAKDNVNCLMNLYPAIVESGECGEIGEIHPFNLFSTLSPILLDISLFGAMTTSLTVSSNRVKRNQNFWCFYAHSSGY